MGRGGYLIRAREWSNIEASHGKRNHGDGEGEDEGGVDEEEELMRE